ncbi:transposable element Tcb1 transposase [Trichonephila clavipes]|nr:transposable element Tcb1 transposase [Trichonephila clavipes]
MDWPAYSPDLNPIEHVWDMLGRRIAARQPPPTCLPELRRALIDEWCNISQDQIDNLILSMPRRYPPCPGLATRDRRATLPQIAADFKAGPSTSVTVRTIQRNIIDMGFRSRRPTRVSLLTERHKALRLTWARQHRY